MYCLKDIKLVISDRRQKFFLLKELCYCEEIILKCRASLGLMMLENNFGNDKD